MKFKYFTKLKGDVPMSIPQEKKLEMLRSMLRIRYFDEYADELVTEGEVHGEVHQYIGQEAVAVGVCAVLSKEDAITSNHRGHGHLIAKGGSINKMFAELGGRATGYCKGKGGSMHITSLDLGIYGTNGMVGQGVPIAAGVGFAFQYEGKNNVAVTFFGDGAANEGSVHEAMNMAAIWNLPIIFVCENNQYGLTLPVKESIKVEDIADRAQGYGMQGVVVDGMDVLAVHDAVSEAVERARNNGGPTFIEAKTYRYYGHFGSEALVVQDPYRTQEEIDSYRQKDPINRLKDQLLEEGVAEETLKSIEKEVESEIKNGIAFMKESDFPSVEEAYEDAYALTHKTMPVKGWV